MKEKRFKEIVSEGIADLFYIWWQELKAVVKDQGVLIFFILVPLGYSRCSWYRCFKCN